MKTQLSYIFILALGALAGCTQSSIIIGGDDAGPDARADGGGAVRCGPATCSDGLVCCNESCGICAAPGDTCTTIACAPVTCGGVVCEGSAAACCAGCDGDSFCSGPGGECPAIDCVPTCGDDVCGGGEVCCGDCEGAEYCSAEGCPELPCPPSCEAQDARSGAAACAVPLGYAWNGSFCDLIVCTCEGSDCESLYETEEDCASAHSACTPTTCSSDSECDDDEWCNPCAHGSCPVCDDCVQDCAPHSCATGRSAACRALRPDCGEDGVAVVDETLCWECVDRATCEPLPADCRTTGCDDASVCEECAGVAGILWTCIPVGAAC